MQTIGERLEEARKRKGISIREAAEATKVRGDYLHKFESNQFDIKLPDIYVRGFLRIYSSYLKLPPEKIVNDYLALGLADPKTGRAINREVYGRMDLSVTSAKPGAGRTDAVGEAPSPAAAAISPAGDGHSDNNPATFRPRAAGGFSVDPALLIKGGVLLGGAVILVLLLIWGIGALSQRNSEPGITWVKPQSGERILNLVAINPVDLVTVTDKAGAILFRGPLKAGEPRPLPYNDAMTIVTETPQSVQVGVGASGKLWPLSSNQTSIKSP